MSIVSIYIHPSCYLLLTRTWIFEHGAQTLDRVCGIRALQTWCEVNLSAWIASTLTLASMGRVARTPKCVRVTSPYFAASQPLPDYIQNNIDGSYPFLM